jgi:hypothetical protein
MMEANEKRIDNAKEQISRLYHDRVNIEEAVKLIRDYDISAELVQNTYAQLSENVKNLMAKRFHYYTIDLKNRPFIRFNAWTTRYLLAYHNYRYTSADSDFHDITVFDVFNDTSM